MVPTGFKRHLIWDFCIRKSKAVYAFRTYFWGLHIYGIEHVFHCLIMKILSLEAELKISKYLEKLAKFMKF